MTPHKTGWCAANYTETEAYTPEQCGPIRATSTEAERDATAGHYEGERWVGPDGYLYVDPPEADEPEAP